MSRGFKTKNTEIRGELIKELRQFHELGTSFYRAAASRNGMSVTDLQVLDILESSGPSTAGQLADLTGLTTGAITGMLNRLEEANLVRRERDPNDGRRVIVQLVRGKDETHEGGSTFENMAQAWGELASQYDDQQIALLLDFLQRSNELARAELARLRETPSSQGGIYSAPLDGLESARLVISSGLSRLTMSVDEAMGELYQASFEGSVPEVRVKDGAVTIRYPRSLLSLVGGEHRVADIKLSPAVPWHIAIQGGSGEIVARLGSLNLTGLELKGGLSMIKLELPVPSGVVPIRLSGGASMIDVRRPAGIAARAHLKGWASMFVFDDQDFSNMGNNVWLQSSNFDPAAPYYDIEVASSVSTATITTS
jgi:DNA-binding MarR family transcriptional regulator